MFQFENFRVRKLKAINALNFYITLCMAFLAMISMESETNALKVSIIKAANPVKEKVFFCYYRLAKGISGILSYAKEGVRLWFRTRRPAYRQLCLNWLFKLDKRIDIPKARFRRGLLKCFLITELPFLKIFQKSRQIWYFGQTCSFLNYILRKLKSYFSFLRLPFINKCCKYYCYWYTEHNTKAS